MTQNPSTASNSKQSPPVLQLVRISIVQRCHYFLHPTPDTLASSLRADSFLALCQNAGFAVLLIALAFFTLLIFVCRQILLPQLPREN